MPEAVQSCREESRLQASAPENALESPSLEEMRNAAARALIQKNSNTAKQLIPNLAAAGADLDLLTHKGNTLLNIAVLSDHRDITKLLLEKRAAATTEDDCGYTALHNAVQRGNVDIMNDLLTARANPYATSVTGCTPSTLARVFTAPALHGIIRKTLCDYGFVEDDSENKLWAKRRRIDLNEAAWRADEDVEYMPMV